MGIWRPTGDSQWSDRHESKRYLVNVMPIAPLAIPRWSPNAHFSCTLHLQRELAPRSLISAVLPTSVGASFPVVDEEYTRNGHLERKGTGRMWHLRVQIPRDQSGTL
jgi:hypothetical protein